VNDVLGSALFYVLFGRDPSGRLVLMLETVSQCIFNFWQCTSCRVFMESRWVTEVVLAEINMSADIRQRSCSDGNFVEKAMLAVGTKRLSDVRNAHGMDCAVLPVVPHVQRRYQRLNIGFFNRAHGSTPVATRFGCLLLTNTFSERSQYISYMP
jgi:hypothetical protein